MQLRQSLINGRYNASDSFGTAENVNEDNGYDNGIPDFEQPDHEMPERMFMDEDLPFDHQKVCILVLFL